MQYKMTKHMRASNLRIGEMLWLLALALFAMLYPAGLLAVDTPIGNIFCKETTWFTGNTGKGIATIAVTVFGFGALLGKVSWGAASLIGLGVAIFFGAAGVVEAFGVPGVPAGCNTAAVWR